MGKTKPEPKQTEPNLGEEVRCLAERAEIGGLDDVEPLVLARLSFSFYSNMIEPKTTIDLNRTVEPKTSNQKTTKKKEEKNQPTANNQTKPPNKWGTARLGAGAENDGHRQPAEWTKKVG